MENRNYWYLFFAQAISALGDYFGLVAIQWLVFKMTGSLLAMGWIALALGLPEMICRLIRAPLIDRLNRLRLMAAMDLIRFAAFAFPVLLKMAGVLQLWHLFVTAIIAGACSALFNPASMAVIPSLIKEDKLVKGFSLMDSSMYAAVIIGPALAGTVISSAGPACSLFIDALSFLISAVLIFLLSIRAKNIDTKESSPLTLKAYFNETIQGLLFFKHVPALFFIMCFVAIKNMSSVAVAAVLVPYGLQVLHLEATKIGLLSSATALGLLAGSILVGSIGNVEKRRLPMLGSVFMQGVLYIALGYCRSFWGALIIYALLGMCGPFFGTFSSYIYSRIVPNDLRGRVMSARLLVGGSLQPLGSYLGGSISQQFGIPGLFIAAGFIPASISLIGFILPMLKEIDGELTEVSISRTIIPGV